MLTAKVKDMEESPTGKCEGLEVGTRPRTYGKCCLSAQRCGKDNKNTCKKMCGTNMCSAWHVMVLMFLPPKRPFLPIIQSSMRMRRRKGGKREEEEEEEDEEEERGEEGGEGGGGR